CKGRFDLNYNNHRMGDVPLNEVIGRLIFLIRLLKVDTVVGWDPWGHDEENPDHYTTAKALEAACWMAGRAHGVPQQMPAGVESRSPSRTNTTSPVVPKSPAWWTSADRSIRRSTRSAPMSPRGRAAIQDRGCGPNWRRAINACRCWAMTTPRPTAITFANSA